MNLPLQLKSSPPQISSPEPTHTARMGYSTFKPFHSLQDGKEDLEEYLKDVKFSYNNDYTGSKALNKSNHKETTSQVLFHQHLKGDAVKWYFNLPKATKGDWIVLKQMFQEDYKLKDDKKVKTFMLWQ